MTTITRVIRTQIGPNGTDGTEGAGSADDPASVGALN